MAVMLSILWVVFAPAPTAHVAAQSAEEYELIELINALRASRGLAAYTVDPGLMAMAREHSVYQASIHTSTHQHSDGQGPPQLGVVENVAGGDLGYITPQNVVYDIWVMDAGHLRTLVGFASGSLGVGIADDGVTTYYTLEVRPGDAAPTPGPADAGSTPALLTPIPILPLVTMTPLADGSILHLVGYGQTLWAIAIAYGVTVDQIRAWNNLPEGATDIYAGQKLLVRPLSLVTPLATAPAGEPLEMLVSPTPDRSPTPPPRPGMPSAALPAAEADGTSAPIEAAAAEQPPAPGGSALPILAGASILIGAALLTGLALLRKKR